MGTVVLFPQDCLPVSRSRQRGNLADGVNGVCMASDSTFQLFDPRPLHFLDGARNVHTPIAVVGSLYPYRVRNGYGLSPLQVQVERRKSNVKRQGDPKEGGTHKTILAAGFTVLQQTKIGTLGIKGTGMKPCKIASNTAPDRKKNFGSYQKKGFCDPKSANARGCSAPHPQAASTQLGRSTEEDIKPECYTPANLRRGSAVRPRKSCDDGMMPWKKLDETLAYEFSAEQNHGPLHASGEVRSRLVPGNQTPKANGPEMIPVPTGLRRALTDPQLLEHLGLSRTQLLPIPGRNGAEIRRTSSLPIPERWAGPAYSASPAPSSLPLPKFSFLGQKTMLLHAPSTIEQRIDDIAIPCKDRGLASNAPAPVQAAVKLDVAFATMSLRRMLKLDLL